MFTPLAAHTRDLIQHDPEAPKPEELRPNVTPIPTSCPLPSITPGALPNWNDLTWEEQEEILWGCS